MYMITNSIAQKTLSSEKSGSRDKSLFEKYARLQNRHD